MRNIQFTIFQTIAIFLVLFGHKGEWLLPEVYHYWPLYSYHLPLFIFISGYFFRPQSIENVGAFCWKKCKTLLFPYFGWNLFYGLVMWGLTAWSDFNFYGNSDFYQLFDISHDYPNGFHLTWYNFFFQPWLNGHQYWFNLASWFVLTLFITQIIYVLIRKLCQRITIMTEGRFMLFFLAIGVVAVYLSSYGFGNTYVLPLLKMMFFLPFYHFGYWYKAELEDRDTLPNGKYFFLLGAIQILISANFTNLAFGAFAMYFPEKCSLLPFITSTIGILFWLRVSKLLVPMLGKCRAVLCIGENTWSIMMHHLTCFFLLNLILWCVSPGNIDKQAFHTDFMYTSPLIPVWVYWIVGLYLPILWQRGFDRYKITFRLKK